jgi:hypothetical protein
LIAVDVTDFLASFFSVTAFDLSCALPTLFFGSVAAQLTPPSAMNKASDPTTLVYVSFFARPRIELTEVQLLC